MVETAPIVLGWCEVLALPDLAIPAIEAKLDTGARSSSLHVDSQSCFERDGREWVRFDLHLDGEAAKLAVQAEAPIHDRRAVRDSGGHETVRIFILTTLSIAGLSYTIEVNLAARRGLKFPMLLGRTALAGRFLIDAARKHALSHAVQSSP